MADVTCIHTWCERQANHGTDPDDWVVHEDASRTVSGVEGCVSTQIEYRDGDREPTLFVGDAQMSMAGVEQLITVLGERLTAMRSVEPTPSLVAR